MSGKARGGKKKFIGHKGGHRHFTDYEELKAQQVEIKKEKERKDEESGEEEEEGKAEAGPASKPSSKSKSATNAAKKDSSSSSGSEASGSSDDEDDEKHRKGVGNLIEIENPNRVKQKMKKVTDLKVDDSAQLSRKEREAQEKERARQEYQRLHALGKTDEAQADLARLQIIRKQREEAAKKKEAERLAREQADKQKQAQKLTGGATSAAAKP